MPRPQGKKGIQEREVRLARIRIGNDCRHMMPATDLTLQYTPQRPSGRESHNPTGAGPRSRTARPRRKSMPSAASNDTFTTSDQTTIAFTRHSAPHAGAPRLVLIHSLALDRHMWDAIVARLEPHAEVLTYDCRGHGQSDRKPGHYTAELFADDLAQLLDHVGWSTSAVGGCSMGGCVALAFAGLHPTRVSRARADRHHAGTAKTRRRRSGSVRKRRAKRGCAGSWTSR